MLNAGSYSVNKLPLVIKAGAGGRHRNVVKPPTSSNRSSSSSSSSWLSCGKLLQVTARAQQHSHKSVRVSKNIEEVNEKDGVISLKAIVSVKPTVGGILSNLGLTRGLDDITDLLGKSLLLGLVCTQLHPKVGTEKATIKAYAHRTRIEDGVVNYEAEFKVPAYFGEVGAVVVENEHHKEMYVTQILIHGFILGPLRFTCNSWVHPKSHLLPTRIFFTNKSYLPSQTPSGLKRMREKELKNMRGDGEGERKSVERVYDYDTYNDLGDPDKDADLARPVLGGSD